MWAEHLVIEVGDLYIGVRVDTPELGVLIRGAFGAHVTEGVEAPPNYSVVTGRGDGLRRPLTLVYRRSGLVERSSDPRRVVATLAGFLSSHGERRVASPHLRVAAIGLLGERCAVLAPLELASLQPALNRHLRRHGLRTVGRPWAEIDPATRELVVPAPTLTIDWDAVASGGRADPPVAPGRYPLVGWGLAASPGPDISAAQAVMHATLATDIPSGTGARVLGELAGLLAALAVRRIAGGSATAAAADLAELGAG